MRKGKPLSLLTFCFNQDGTKEIQELLGRGIFDFPKPTSLIKYFLSLRFNDKEDTDFYVLDFFSGSASTAHAVMKLNAEDGGRRKFIMVQLPETCKEGTEAYKAGYKNICEIGKERIRRAGKQILEELKTKNGDLFSEDVSLDIGFRDLKLDSSNMNDVYYTPDETDQRMLDGLESNIKGDRTAEDLLFQVMLDLGVLLSAKIIEEDIGGKKVFNVDDNYLIACFDENVDETVIMEAAKKKPTYFVMRDSSLANDSASVWLCFSSIRESESVLNSVFFNATEANKEIKMVPFSSELTITNNLKFNRFLMFNKLHNFPFFNCIFL